MTSALLPHGCWMDNTCHREARLRPLTGADELVLAESSGLPHRAQRTTALLSRCVTQIGSITQVTAETMRALTVGDRDFLILQLRCLTFGEKMECVLRCPQQECGKHMDLDLTVSELLLSPYPEPRPQYQATIADNGTTYYTRFRLPNGGDQEEAAPLARYEPEAAARLVLERCVEKVGRDAKFEESVQEIPPAVATALPRIMAELDPQAEIVLQIACPACGSAIPMVFDGADYLYRELAGHTRELYWEVHRLALAYHWSEVEILAMSPRKRALYRGLLAEEQGLWGRR